MSSPDGQAGPSSPDPAAERVIPERLRQLVRFLETYERPVGVSWVEFLASFDALMNDVPVPIPVPEIVTVRRMADWNLRIALWRVSDAPDLPVVIHLHGGAWTSGNHLTHRGLAAELAARGYLVVSVDYRRAPKHPFPAAYEDCVAVLDWCTANLAAHGGDPARIALIGDSAGANLAAAVMVTDASPRVRAGALLFGIYDYHRNLERLGSLSNASGYVRHSELDQLRGDPRLSPEAAAGRLPFCCIAVGGRDRLVGEAEALHQALEADDRPHVYQVIPGAPHSYIQLPGHPDYAEGIESLAGFLGYALRDEPAPAAWTSGGSVCFLAPEPITVSRS